MTSCLDTWCNLALARPQQSGGQGAPGFNPDLGENLLNKTKVKHDFFRIFMQLPAIFLDNYFGKTIFP